MMNEIMNEAMLADTCNYLYVQSGASDEKAAGVAVAVVGTLMALGRSFEDAIAVLGKRWRPGYRLHCVPECWRDELLKHIA